MPRHRRLALPCTAPLMQALIQAKTCRPTDTSGSRLTPQAPRATFATDGASRSTAASLAAPSPLSSSRAAAIAEIERTAHRKSRVSRQQQQQPPCNSGTNTSHVHQEHNSRSNVQLSGDHKLSRAHAAGGPSPRARSTVRKTAQMHSLDSPRLRVRAGAASSWGAPEGGGSAQDSP